VRRPDEQLMVLLLPERLESFRQRAIAEDLLQADGVVAVDPPRTSYARLSRIPDAFGVSIASKQARRLRRRLPGTPHGVTIFHPAQYPLARALLTQLPDCELWYGRVSRPEAELEEGPARRRLEELHILAAERAALTFVTTDELGREEALAGRRAVAVAPGVDHAPLWNRLPRVLGVAVGG
jgi:hypothetical protein